MLNKKMVSIHKESLAASDRTKNLGYELKTRLSTIIESELRSQEEATKMRDSLKQVKMGMSDLVKQNRQLQNNIDRLTNMISRQETAKTT